MDEFLVWPFIACLPISLPNVFNLLKWHTIEQDDLKLQYLKRAIEKHRNRIEVFMKLALKLECNTDDDDDDDDDNDDDDDDDDDDNE